MRAKLKLGVDLDQTVIFSDCLELANHDFSHHFPTDQNRLYFVKRQHCDTFFKWAIEHFDVYILSAATQDYVEYVVDQLEIKDKIKGIKSRSEWGEKESVRDEYGSQYQDYVKKVDDFIVVDDKDYIFKGENNTIIKVSQCWINKDNELLRVISELEKILFEPIETNVRTTFSHVYFFGDVFSNFYNCKFTINGQEYSSVEQYYMRHKALHFNDMETAKKIMNENHSFKIKKLGNNSKIKNFNKEEWDQVKDSYMTEACFAKFSQNEELRSILLSTGSSTLAEASPFDFYWGSGVALNDKRILDASECKGQNKLGQILMKVRDQLK
jgi:ribA/ribD-fused uncharacterized protein